MDDQLEVHDQGSNHADVTEGGKGAWERLSYDWSDPSRIVMATTDSNVWGNDSVQTYVLAAKADGTTEVDVVVERHGKNLKGRFLGFVLGTVGKGALQRRWIRPSRRSRHGTTERKPRALPKHQLPIRPALHRRLGPHPKRRGRPQASHRRLVLELEPLA